MSVAFVAAIATARSAASFHVRCLVRLTVRAFEVADARMRISAHDFCMLPPRLTRIQIHSDVFV